MLLLNRDIGESILIGDDIEIKIMDNRGRVCVGIQAPKNVRILRSEIVRKGSLTNTAFQARKYSGA